MLEVKEFKRPPKDVLETEDKAAERAIVFLKSRLKPLSPDKTSLIEKKLDKWYMAWKLQTQKQRDRLVKYSDLLEGIVEDSNTPFEGASNITLHYAAGMTRTFRANFNKTAYKDEDLFYAMPSPELKKRLGDQPEKLQALDEAFNYSFSRACNGLETLKEGTVPCVRDGTLVITGRWFREVIHCFDQRIYRDLDTFRKDYPTFESAGISEEEYADVLDFFLVHSDNAGQQSMDVTSSQYSGNLAGVASSSTVKADLPELIVGFEYDYVRKNEPEYRIGPWAKFVRYPLSAKDLPGCLFYGYQIVRDREDVKLKARRGEFYKLGVQKALKVGQQEMDNWDKSIGFVEGITQPVDGKDKPFRPIEGVCMLDLDNDGIPEKYLVEYEPESKALWSLTPYRLRRGCESAVVFRMVKRENRLDGVSLIGDCEDLFVQIDFNTRHRNNVRILTTSPVFLANSKYKDQIDLGRAENVVRPGVTYWVDDPDKAIKQMQLQDLSSTMDNMDELRLYKEHVELVFGPTQGMSGMQTPQDPRAPARKTQMLMTQSGVRLDDYLDQYMESGPALAELHSALLFQFAEGPELNYNTGTKVLSLPLDILGDKGLKWGVKRRSYQLTPEFAMARLDNLQNTWLVLLPRISAGDPIAIEMWNRHVLASGEPQADKFLLSGQNLQKVQQSFMALMQMNPQSPDTKAQFKGKEAFHKEIGRMAAQHLTGQISPISGQNGKSQVG